MEAEVVLQVRMDKKTKDKVEKLYRDMGITFATAVRLFAKQSLVEERLPFVVSKKPVLAGGMLSKYADKTKWKKEKKALEKGIVEEYEKNKWYKYIN